MKANPSLMGNKFEPMPRGCPWGECKQLELTETLYINFLPTVCIMHIVRNDSLILHTAQSKFFKVSGSQGAVDGIKTMKSELNDNKLW